jgi:catechol 2,3-dioxygenase-like lactoylglutathione lyase family enzyme
MLGEHPITLVLLATDLAAARKFYHGKLGLQIVRENENAIMFRCGNSTPGPLTGRPGGMAGQRHPHGDGRTPHPRHQGRRLRHPGPATEVLADEPSWTRKAARATLDIAIEERECERALLRNGR